MAPPNYNLKMAKKSSSSARKYNGTALLAVLVKIKPLKMCNMYAPIYIISWNTIVFVEGV
jgi:hypothetical protein